MSDMQLIPENVNKGAFARMLADSNLRPILGVSLSQQAAEAILASTELTDDYYRQWAKQTSGAASPSQYGAGVAAPIPSDAAPLRRAVQLDALSLRSAIHSLVWPAVGCVIVLLFGLLGVGIWLSDRPYYGRDAAFIWIGIGYFLAIAACIVGIAYGTGAIRAGLEADRTVPRRVVSIVLGTIGLLGSVFLTLSWIVGWATMRA